MRRRQVADAEAEDYGVDLTPMLDIVFIMLIFFIVSTSFVRESGIEVNKPTAQSATDKPKANIMVAIKANDEIWIDRRQVDVRAVRANIERLRATNPEGSVIIVADEQSRNGVMVKVMDQIKLAGVENVSVAATQASP